MSHRLVRLPAPNGPAKAPNASSATPTAARKTRQPPGRGKTMRPPRSTLEAAPLIPQFCPPARDELLELVTDRVVERRLLVAFERLAPDVRRARGRVERATLRPAVEVLGRG